jgi:hypothetical protein
MAFNPDEMYKGDRVIFVVREAIKMVGISRKILRKF